MLELSAMNHRQLQAGMNDLETMWLPVAFMLLNATREGISMKKECCDQFPFQLYGNHTSAPNVSLTSMPPTLLGMRSWPRR